MIKHTISVVDDTVRFRNIFGKEIDLGCSLEQWNLCYKYYVGGALIQNAFYFLNSEQREFLISGMTAEEWAFQNKSGGHPCWECGATVVFDKELSVWKHESNDSAADALADEDHLTYPDG